MATIIIFTAAADTMQENDDEQQQRQPRTLGGKAAGETQRCEECFVGVSHQSASQPASRSIDRSIDQGTPALSPYILALILFRPTRRDSLPMGSSQLSSPSPPPPPMFSLDRLKRTLEEMTTLYPVFLASLVILGLTNPGTVTWFSGPMITYV